MRWVWKHSQAKPTDRLVLLAIADVASDEGEVTAYRRSQNALADKTGLTTRCIRASIGRLVELGELEVLQEGDGRRSSDYRMPMIEGGTTFLPARKDVPPREEGDSAQGGTAFPPIIPSLSVLPSSSPALPSPPAPAKATRLPEPFMLTAEMREWGQREYPGVDLRAETAKFVDHWRAQGGARARKVDWSAAWRNWIRKAAEWRPNGNGNGHLSKSQQSRANLDLWLASSGEVG